ncbi:hypothetical protein EON67_08070, partial [archaeon]
MDPSAGFPIPGPFGVPAVPAGFPAAAGFGGDMVAAAAPSEVPVCDRCSHAHAEVRTACTRVVSGVHCAASRLDAALRVAAAPGQAVFLYPWPWPSLAVRARLTCRTRVTCVYARARARARVCVCARTCVLRMQDAACK